MIFVYYFFALIQTFFAYKSLRGGIEYLQFFKKELGKTKSEYTPFATIFVPCRGIDIDLQANLEAIFIQDYPNFEVIFVVDDKNDPAVSVINEFIHRRVAETQSKKRKKDFETIQNNSQKYLKPLASQRLCGKKLLIAGKAMTSGQKVHNLRKAVLEADEKSEVFVFVDSDARPNENWLRNLVEPLADKSVGCATGYRWFIQQSGGIATHLRSVWNASIASTLGENTKGNFCWGGSTAIRREVFEKLNVREKWKGTLSDDFALTNILKEAEMPIKFVPSCLTATVEDCTFKELLEFTTRQMKITRVYSPTHFKVSVIGSILFTFTFWTGIVLLVFATGIHFWLILFLTSIMFIFGIGKAWLRLNAVKLILSDYKNELNKQFLPQILLWTITPILYLYNNISAMFSRKIIWRGIEYKLESASKTFIEKTDG